MALKVLSLAPNHAFAHFILDTVLVYTNRAAQGMAECERALALDHNLAQAHASIGRAKMVMGRGAETEAHINEAFRLSPRDIFAHRWFLIVGLSKLSLSADAEAVGWFLRSIEANQNYPLAHFFLAAALALLGSLGQASAAAKAGLALDPTFTIRRLRDFALTSSPPHHARDAHERASLWECAWPACQRGDVACGSIATESGLSRHVRFTPDSDQTADIPDWQLRALALFGRRLPRRVEAPMIPASENQHTS